MRSKKNSKTSESAPADKIERLERLLLQKERENQRLRREITTLRDKIRELIAELA